MATKSRQDFSFDLWGDPKDAHYEVNKATFKMNPKYGEGTSIFFNSELAIYPALSEYRLDCDLTGTDIAFYKQDSIYLGKLLKGKFALKGKNDERLLFNEGDIFCFSGNFVLNEKFHYNNTETVLTVGLFGYHKEILSAFEKRNWPTDTIKKFLIDPDLAEGVLLNKTDALNQVIDELYAAMTNDDQFSAFVKGVNLFNCVIDMMKRKTHKKVKTYKQQQVDTVIEIKHFLDQNLDAYYAMPKLAKMFNISLSRMQQIFAAYYNLSPYKYHLSKRLEKANHLIINTDEKMINIAKTVGFKSYDKFFEAYKNRYGCSPSKHRTT